MSILHLHAIAAAATLLIAQSSPAQFPPPPPPPPPPPVVTHVVEFSNVQTGRHVWLADPAEIAAVERGDAGPGWARNGYYVDSSSQNDAHRVDVCRFYSPASNSHFLTANPEECSALRAANTDWIYEKVAFRAYAPRPGGCGLAVYRLYNDRAMYGDSAHRFTNDRALRKRLLDEGWVDEGTAFCTDGADREIHKAWRAGGRVAPRADCDDAVAGGTCVMARSLPSLGNTIPFYDPGSSVDWTSVYFMTRLGVRGEPLYTAQPVGDGKAVAANSFAHVVETGFFGFNLVGENRVSGTLATMGVVHALENEGVFPWADGREHDLSLSFHLYAEFWPPFSSADSSQAYGGGVLRFRDRTTGRALMVTLQTFGEGAPGDVVLRDIFTGQPIVSTYFGTGTAFGWTDQGSYSRCSDAIYPHRCSIALYFHGVGPLTYAFRIARADFVKVLAMAREVDPALSANPADYLVSSFQFRGETHLDASMSFQVDWLTLTLSR